MNGPRFWILILAAVSFLAGLAGGLMVAGRDRPGAGAEDFQRLFVSTFDLPPERAALFRELMRNYRDEVEEVRQRALADSMAVMESDLSAIGLRYRDTIRHHVLPEGQRAKFDDLARLQDWNPDR